MNKWLIAIIAALTLAVGATNGSMITFEDIADGQPGSITNPLEKSNFIDIYLSVDSMFFAMDVVVSVSGPAQIVYASGSSDAAAFGWTSAQSNNPIFSTNNVEMGLAVDMSGLKMAGRAAKITLKALGSGQVVLSLSNGSLFEDTSMDSMFRVPLANDTLTIYQTAPEPTTVALLLLGALIFKGRKKILK